MYVNLSHAWFSATITPVFTGGDAAAAADADDGERAAPGVFG